MDNMNNMDNNEDMRHFIKLRGLPWNSTAEDIMEFLENVQVVGGEKGIHMSISPRDGRPNGEAFVELASGDDVDMAFGYNKKSLGHRYIEVFSAKEEEYEQCMRRVSNNMQDTFVKLRGLPFSCKPDDIESFFSGLEIKNGKTGIYIVYDSNGRLSGEAFVQFKSIDDAENALKRNRDKIGHRYIEIFRSSSAEARRTTMFGQQNRGMNDRGFGGNNGNDRGGMNRGGMRGSRGNFRDRPYPDWSGAGNNNNDNNGGGGWRGNRGSGGGGNNFGNNNFNNNDNFGPRNGGGGGGGGLGNNNMNNIFDDFERKWNNNSNDGPRGGGNSFNNRNNNDDGPPVLRGNFGGLGNNSMGGGSFGNSFGNNNSNNGGGGGSFFSRDDDCPPPRNFGNDRNNFNSNSMGNNSGGSSGGMGNSGGPPFLVHLRGMPYDCGEMEVHQFFAPLKLVDCQVIFNNNGRHSGEADAYFATVADAQEAMKKHKEKMGSRYIELYANRKDDRRGRF